MRFLGVFPPADRGLAAAAGCRPEIQDCSVPNNGVPLREAFLLLLAQWLCKSEWSALLYFNLLVTHFHKLYIALAPTWLIQRTGALVRV